MNKKGFSLVEVITSIGILGIIIATLLTVIYNIKISQEKMISQNTLSKKMEYYILSHFLNNYKIYANLKNLITSNQQKLKDSLKKSLEEHFSNDPDIKGLKIKEIKDVEISPNRNIPPGSYVKQIVKLTIKYTNKNAPKNTKTINLFIPYIGYNPPPQQSPTEGNENGSSGSGSSGSSSGSSGSSSTSRSGSGSVSF